MTSSTEQQADVTGDDVAAEAADGVATEATTLDDAYDDDLDFAPRERAGLGRLTTGLIAGIVLVLVFGGGVWAQKHYGGSPTSAAGPSGARSFAAGGFTPPGGATGFNPGGTGTAGSGTTTGSGSSGATGPTAAVPSVIGTVTKVSGRTVTVKNFAGKTVTVTVPKTATVTTVGSLDGLAKGASVAVVGTADADGDVTASAVTVR